MVASTAFASDNASPAHPAAMEAVLAANHDTMPSYGNDVITARAAERLREAFDSPDADVLFALTGTGANIVALAAAVRSWHSILCSDVAHALIDEAGGPVRVSGTPLTALPSADGIIAPAELDRAVAARGDAHQSQPRIVTITQSTEHGRVWDPQTVSTFVDRAHELGLLVHVDGSRLGNAVAALGVPPLMAVGDADIITVGGTKNGMLFGDALLVRRPECFDGIRYVQKQIGHLASKHRFVSAQFDAMFESGLWLKAAEQANAKAARLAAGVCALGFQLAAPTEANAVFVVVDPSTLRAVLDRFAVHVADPQRAVVRFVCSWATTTADVDAVLATLGCRVA